MGFDQALELVRQGQALEAERLLGELADHAKQEHGRASQPHADALYDLGRLRIVLGDVARALEPLREAATIRVPGDDGERQRLTCHMNLGEVLARLDRLDEAEQVLREGLVARAELYGQGHPGYAFGLEPLASVLFRQGKTDEALAMAHHAVRLLWDDGNPRVAMALATRAPMAIVAGGRAFDETSALPEELFDQLVQEVLARGDRDNPRMHLLVLDELQTTIASRRGPSAPAMAHVLAAMTNAAREADEAQARVAAFRVLVAWLDQHGDAAEAVEAVLGLGLALDEGAEPGAAEEAYEDASARAERLGDGDLLARVLRNHALFCAEREHTERALELFDRARTTATGAEAARTSIAFGIFRQHQGALDEAAELLRAGLGGLAPSDPDSLYARTELDAIELQRRARLSYDPPP